jgi:hypothetical protein
LNHFAWGQTERTSTLLNNVLRVEERSSSSNDETGHVARVPKSKESWAIMPVEAQQLL